MVSFKSKALEVNLASYHVDVTIDEKYAVLQEILLRYYGLREGLNTFLKELSHPYRNWAYIVQEGRGYALDYFHLLNKHPRGPEGAALFIGIFCDAFESSVDTEVRIDAVDNLLLFLQRIMRDSGENFERFAPVLNEAFGRITAYGEQDFFFFIKSYYQIKKLAENYLAVAGQNDDYEPVTRLVIRYLEQTYAYWLEEVADPGKWFLREISDDQPPQVPDSLFEPISHDRIAHHRQRLAAIVADGPLDRQTLQRLLELPGYRQIVDVYRRIPQKLQRLDPGAGRGDHWKVIFLFHIMNIAGLSAMHEECLRDINRTMERLIGHENYRDVMYLIRKTFSILNDSMRRYPSAALNCVLNMGRGIYRTDDSDLVKYFIDAVIGLGFQTPMIGGVGDDWQVRANNAHLQNIRVWMQLIGLRPRWSLRLMSALIIYLALGGVFIKDTDLFPRDVTEFLNCDIEGVYNLAKQLFRLLPVFFNDIGAEGELRDISTQLDEITRRKDVLIHFLRKQSHVESSNRILSFMEGVLEFWCLRDKRRLKPFVPPKIFEEIALEGEYIDGVNRLMCRLREQGIKTPSDLLTVSAERLEEMLADEVASETDRRRVQLIVAFYKLLHQKYHFDAVELDHYLEQLQVEAFPNLKMLKNALALEDPKKKVAGLINYLELLKNLILSDSVYEIREDIYKKRHFTVDIPSMYGSYHETKFDAMGLTFRIEALVNVLLEELVETIDLSLITKATFFQVHDLLNLFDRALKVDGMRTTELERQLEPLSHSLEVRGFTFTQYLDIFKNLALAVKNIVHDHFNNIHEQNLDHILSNFPAGQLLPKFSPPDGKEDREGLSHRVSEMFFRDRIATSLGLQQLDRFLTRILSTLFHQAEKLPKKRLHMLLLYDPQRAMTSIYEPSPHMSGLIHLGNKGYNLVRLKKLGLPVPPGFVITTEVFRCREVINSYRPAERNFREQVDAHIHAVERLTGKRFGDPGNPLLLSVRSGSAISQPGMMDTFLNVGITEKITEGVAARTGNPWFAWDNYRRFLQCYGMAMGLERDHFDAIIRRSKDRAGIAYKRAFSGDQMKTVAMAYKQSLLDHGIDIPEDPLEQLHTVVRLVLSSWDSEKAKAYRRIIGISDDWGTAVTVQAMVYGNRSRRSGSGVIFTHNPRWSGDSLRLWGDFTIGNQGEDVVAGLVNTLPISIRQQEAEMRDTDITLETHFPLIYGALRNIAVNLIEDQGWSPQEMEFTFESDAVEDLYLLQTRDMVIRQRKKVPTFDLKVVSRMEVIGHGIGVSGGAMSGRVVFDLDEIRRWRESEPDTSLILLRSDTVPDDIREIHAADGLLTARGGLTSHAAVVAHRLGKTCVVGCGTMMCDEKDKKCTIGQTILKAGDFISMDGQSGAVYRGLIGT